MFSWLTRFTVRSVKVTEAVNAVVHVVSLTASLVHRCTAIRTNSIAPVSSRPATRGWERCGLTSIGTEGRRRGRDGCNRRCRSRRGGGLLGSRNGQRWHGLCGVHFGSHFLSLVSNLFLRLRRKHSASHDHHVKTEGHRTKSDDKGNAEHVRRQLLTEGFPIANRLFLDEGESTVCRSHLGVVVER